MKYIFSLFVLLITTTGLCAMNNTEPKVSIKTNMGTIVLQLNPEKAPATVKNFLDYVDSGFYDGTIFHRVIKKFMIQGGGFKEDMTQKPTESSISNEADNGLGNEKYTIAMARTSDPNSATSQFFINTKDNSFLNFKSKTPQGWGYAVFGKVIKGQDVVDNIENSATGTSGGMRDVPTTHVIIEKMTEVKEKPLLK